MAAKEASRYSEQRVKDVKYEDSETQHVTISEIHSVWYRSGDFAAHSVGPQSQHHISRSETCFNILRYARHVTTKRLELCTHL